MALDLQRWLEAAPDLHCEWEPLRTAYRRSLVDLGFKDEAAVVAAGILEAAEFFDGRLPEASGGYSRVMTKYRVQHPTACSPQAWSTGRPLLLLRTMLGLHPVSMVAS
jgi:glycogen debranching enzyme